MKFTHNYSEIQVWLEINKDFKLGVQFISRFFIMNKVKLVFVGTITCKYLMFLDI